MRTFNRILPAGQAHRARARLAGPLDHRRRAETGLSPGRVPLLREQAPRSFDHFGPEVQPLHPPEGLAPHRPARPDQPWQRPGELAERPRRAAASRGLGLVGHQAEIVQMVTDEDEREPPEGVTQHRGIEGVAQAQAEIRAGSRPRGSKW